MRWKCKQGDKERECEWIGVDARKRKGDVSIRKREEEETGAA